MTTASIVGYKIYIESKRKKKKGENDELAKETLLKYNENQVKPIKPELAELIKEKNVPHSVALNSNAAGVANLALQETKLGLSTESSIDLEMNSTQRKTQKKKKRESSLWGSERNDVRLMKVGKCV